MPYFPTSSSCASEALTRTGDAAVTRDARAAGLDIYRLHTAN